VNKALLIIFLLFTAWQGFAEDKKQPAPPTPPTAPAKPVVPGAAESVPYPRFPSFPRFPNNNNQTNRPEEKKEVEKYDLNVLGAFPNGDTRKNVANTINNAQYILYSDGTIELKMSFTNGAEYIYHLRNSRSKIEISRGVFRETFETVVQVGKELLMERYSGELCYNSNTIISFNLIGDNKVVVLLNLARKT
jgi:hypothetical protein